MTARPVTLHLSTDDADALTRLLGQVPTGIPQSLARLHELCEAVRRGVVDQLRYLLLQRAIAHRCGLSVPTLRVLLSAADQSTETGRALTGALIACRPSPQEAAEWAARPPSLAQAATLAALRYPART